MHRCLAGLAADVDRRGDLGEPGDVLGLELQLRLLGAFSLENRPEGPLGRPLALSLRLRPLAGSWRELPVHGTIDAAGLASAQPVSGHLHVERPRVVLALRFEGDDGSHCELTGATTLRVAGIPPEFTKLEGELSIDEARRGPAHLRFDVRSNLAGALRSLRLVPSQPER